MSEHIVKGYHAHIYYDPQRTREAAASVRAGLAAFNVQLGSWHDAPVGPHLDAMYQAVFTRPRAMRTAITSNGVSGSATG